MIPLFILLLLFFSNCEDSNPGEELQIEEPIEQDFVFGADLSYVNQILDYGGVYTDNGEVKNPYQIFSEQGTNLVRLRLWHNPSWTKDVYEDGTQLYNDLADVERAIEQSKMFDMKVLLDFHYSDTWADPGTQQIPEAWLQIRDIQSLKDSVYHYTHRTLTYLNSKGLLPDFVQIGNETNCGMFISNVPDGFPLCNVCNGHWDNMGAVVNSGIQAVRDVASSSENEITIILHVADPVNVPWWFDNMIAEGGVSDFDVIGFSYYPVWHTGVSVAKLSETVAGFISRFDKKVMILETAYPWTSEANDDYNNIFGSQAIAGYPISEQGQLAMLKTITQRLIDGGGSGIIYWEPAWISSEMKDKWGTGSAWENNAFFDFEGEVNQSMEYMKYDYDFNK